MSRDSITFGPTRNDPDPYAPEVEEEDRADPFLSVREQESEAIPHRTKHRAPRPAEDRERSAENARRIAQMKFGFFKTFLFLVLANTFFFTVAWLEVGLGPRYWFVWPLGLSVLALVNLYLKAFVMRGRTLQGYIDSVLDRMEEREIYRQSR